MRNIIRAISGLSFFERTNCKDWFVIASYHHPDSITWRWSLSYYLPTKKTYWRWPKIKPGYFCGQKYRSPNGNFSGGINIPLIGSFWVSTQEHMWRK